MTIIGFIFKEDILWAFGASKHTISYALDYLSIYLIGTIFVLVSLGMNSFINSQGFAKVGMMTVLHWRCFKYCIRSLCFIFVYI